MAEELRLEREPSVLVRRLENACDLTYSHSIVAGGLPEMS
jgi:hypothetical protein